MRHCKRTLPGRARKPRLEDVSMGHAPGEPATKRSFRVNEWAKPEALLPRLRNPELRDCSSLNLDRNLLGPEGMRGLAQINFPRLVELELFANRIGDQGAAF